MPNQPWQYIFIDFEEIPEDDVGFNMVVVFIDRLSEKAVSIPCKKTVNARDMAEIYSFHCFRHIGVPGSIVSGRGPQFFSYFWTSLYKLPKI